MARRGAPSDRGSGSRLPSFPALVEFLRGHPQPAGAREIARAFGLGPGDIAGLRGMLRAIERSGEVARGGDRKFIAGEALPDILPVERFANDTDGTPLVRPVGDQRTDAPSFRLIGAAGDELADGGRALARLIRRDNGEVEAEIIRRLDPSGARVVGVFRRSREGGVIVAADRRNRSEYHVLAHDAAGLADDELVVAEELPSRRFGKRARIIERLGPANAPGAISRMMIAEFEIPAEFPDEVIAAAATAPHFSTAGRTDLRHLALVTIDGSDARDFDDAVWAEPDGDAANPGAWHLIVAIADVAAYVLPGQPLDREAAKRGNSVYFPDRVVPMLPETLSNDLCSLKPGEDRPCIAAELWIDSEGRKLRHRFMRAVMRSAARLTYEAVQAAHDSTDRSDFPLAAERLDALYGAFAALDRAREARGALNLDLPEHRVVLDQGGKPSAVVLRSRLDSHRLIEEMMILANVAAAEELESRQRACMYRVHDQPDPEKLNALRDYLDEVGISGLALAKGQVVRPALFNRLLARAATTPEATVINELVLRTQAQAVYSPRNIGHFGLALPRYAHFTSPIRRYADLLVHRALLGEAPPAREAEAAFGAIGEHISATERRAAAAERAALDRYRAMLLSGQIGTVFEARISGVAPFGLFLTLPESGADGLIPISTLPSDYYDHDASRHRLVGRRYGRIYALGNGVQAALVEADAIGGRLVFRLEDDDPAPRRPSPKARVPRMRGRR